MPSPVHLLALHIKPVQHLHFFLTLFFRVLEPTHLDIKMQPISQDSILVRLERLCSYHPKYRRTATAVMGSLVQET